MMLARLADHDPVDLRIRDRIALAVRLAAGGGRGPRTGAPGHDVVCPCRFYAPDGWGVAILGRPGGRNLDRAWADSSTDFITGIYASGPRWRASKKYPATVLFWLGDDRESPAARWGRGPQGGRRRLGAFWTGALTVVMQIERVEGDAGAKNPVFAHASLPGRAAVLVPVIKCANGPAARWLILPCYMPPKPQRLTPPPLRRRIGAHPTARRDMRIWRSAQGRYSPGMRRSMA